MRKDTFRTILIAIGVLILLAIVALGSAVWLFVRSFHVGKMDAATAAREFDGIRGRFAGVSPLLAIRDEQPVVTRRPSAGAAPTRLTTMHIVAWDSEDDELVRIDLPF